MHGTGEMAFLTRIDGTQNVGGRPQNWTYTVNGKPGRPQLCRVLTAPGDHVLWTFSLGSKMGSKLHP